MQVDWIRVEGNSMRPFIRSGDLIGVHWRRDENFGLGEIVLGQGEDRDWIVHRFIGRVSRTSSQILIKGDASPITETFAAEKIWGRIIAVRRGERGRVFRLNANWLDRTIAFFSRNRLRRTTFALGFARRFLL